MNTKKKYFLLFFVFIAYQTLLPQWSTDPNNNLIVGYGLDPNICSDSVGGCYITYDYDNLSYPRKLALERIDRYGYKPWGTKKQILGELPGQWKAEIVEDGEGGVIISYQDWFINSPDYTSRVRVQRVDSSDNFLWGATGIRVTIDEINQGSQKLVSDGSGGCIIIWQDSLSRYSINRINRFGEKIWGASGFVLGTGQYSKIVRASDGCYYVQIGTVLNRLSPNGQILWQASINLGEPIADNEGGVVLSERVWTGMIPKLVTQRKDSLGNNLWQDPYVEIADSLYINTQLRIQNNNGYYYYGWSGTKNGINNISQFQVLREDGSKLFPTGSIKISENTPLSSPYIIPTDSGRTILIWNDGTITSTTFAQMYDTLGNKLWNENGVVVSYPALTIQTVTDGQGGFITCGPINEFTIVAQQLSRYGNLGEVLSVPVELISFFGIVDQDKVKLNWTTASELNNQGFEIERRQMANVRSETELDWAKIGFVEGHGTTTEPHSYTFTDNDIVEGKIKYRLKQIDFDGTFEYSNEIEVNADITPKEFVLHQNYPNPFNSSTIIKYQIPEEGRLTINLYNILGEKVKTLFQGDQIKGTYTLVVQSVELPSGHYFYSLESSSTRIIKKFTFLK